MIRVDGKSGIRLSVTKQSGANTVAVARAVKEELAQINRDFPDLSVLPIFDQSTFIEQSNRNVRNAADLRVDFWPSSFSSFFYATCGARLSSPSPYPLPSCPLSP